MTPNIKYKLFQLVDVTKGKFLRLVPSIFIPKILNTDIQIGITTYVDRYDDYFKPLYNSLVQLFPQIDIIVAVNGFHDKDVQNQYLTRLHKELCTRNLNRNRFILHDKPVGLTRLWNELISHGNSRTTLILNDDLRIYPWFRSWLARKNLQSDITLINGTWSHFFFSKDMLGVVGWFDESFQGIGFEDMDYTARCYYRGVRINNLKCQYIDHLDHQPERTSFDDRSSTYWGPKYSSINHQRFFEKWTICNHDSGIFIKQLNSFVEPRTTDNERHDEINLQFKNGVCYPDRY